MSDPVSNMTSPTRDDLQAYGADAGQPDQSGGLSDLALLRALYNIANDVKSDVGLQEALERATQNVVEALNVTHATVFLYDFERGAGEVVAEYPAMNSVGTKIVRNENPALMRMEFDPKPIIIPRTEDGQDMLGAVQSLVLERGIKSMLLVPIRAGNRLLGSVTVDVYETHRNFTKREVEGLQAIAAQLSTSIRNAQLYAELERRASVSTRLAVLGQQIMASLDRNTAFQTAAGAARELIGADGVSAALRGPDDKMMYLYLINDPATGTALERPTVVELPFGETALRFVCNSGETLVLEDFSSSDYADYQVLAQHAAPDSWGSGKRLRAAVVTPVQAGGRIIGTFNATGANARQFTKVDGEVLGQIAGQLSVALENARMYTQAAERSQVERLMTQLAGNAGQSDIQTVVTETMREIGSALGARRARVRLQMPNAETLDVKDMQRLRKMLDSRPSSQSRVRGSTRPLEVTDTPAASTVVSTAMTSTTGTTSLEPTASTPTPAKPEGT